MLNGDSDRRKLLVVSLFSSLHNSIAGMQSWTYCCILCRYPGDSTRRFKTWLHVLHTCKDGDGGPVFVGLHLTFCSIITVSLISFNFKYNFGG